MDLVSSVREFDGKHISALERVAATLPRTEESVTQLLALAEHDESKIQVAATWILKRWHEQGTPEIEKSADSLIQTLKHANHWEVRLHLLQMLAELPIPARSSARLTKLLPDLVSNDNKLVRAWALTVLASIADQRIKLRAEVITMLQNAEEDEAASVRARTRQLRKRYKWMGTGQK